MFGFRPQEQEAAVVQTTILSTDLYTRVSLLGLPAQVRDLIFAKDYFVGIDPVTGIEIRDRLFGHSRDATQPFGWRYKPYEIQEIVRVYDLIKGQFISTGEEDSLVGQDWVSSPDRKILDDQQAFEAFQKHLDGLATDRERKLRRGLFLTVDDTVFESPALAEERRLETIKINLSNRKRIPTKGISCPACKHDECYQEESFERAGDEGGVWYTRCAKCDRKFKS